MHCEIYISQWPRNTTKLTTNRKEITQYSLLVVLIEKAGRLGYTPSAPLSVWSLVKWFSNVSWFHHLGDDWKGAKKEAARGVN